jgi:hypothetical protein
VQVAVARLPCCKAYSKSNVYHVIVPAIGACRLCALANWQTWRHRDRCTGPTRRGCREASQNRRFLAYLRALLVTEMRSSLNTRPAGCDSLSSRTAADMASACTAEHLLPSACSILGYVSSYKCVGRTHRVPVASQRLPWSVCTRALGDIVARGAAKRCKCQTRQVLLQAEY